MININHYLSIGHTNLHKVKKKIGVTDQKDSD